MMTPPANLRARVLAAATAQPSRTRAQGRTLLIVLVMASIIVALTFFELAGGVAHSQGRPFHLTYALAGGLALGSAVLGYFVFARVRSTLARAPRILRFALATPFVVFLWMQLFAGAYVEPFQKIGYRCFGLTVAMSILPLATFLGLRRGIEPREPSMLGAAAGAVCGAAAGVLVDLWCPLTNATHAVVGHVLPLVLLMVIGALVGRRTLGVRAR